MNLLAALGQAFDFLFKAARSYSETPEGAKELSDVIIALEGSENQPADNGETAEQETVSSRIRR
jgi:hypothetical protein